MLNLHNAVCQLHLNFSSLCKAALLKNHVSDTIKTQRLLRLPFQRQTAQRVTCVNPETAVMGGEAQSVGLLLSLEAILTLPSQLTSLAQGQ